MWNSVNHSQIMAVYESDEFRMYSFKVKRCSRLRSHDWTQCPFAHRSERASRRDPRVYNYCALPCPDFRDIGTCFRGEGCPFSHGVFEQWLHPHRYRTRLCSAGLNCQRQVCFFAHSIHELRAEEPPMVYMPQPCPEVHVGASSSSQVGPSDPSTNVLNAFAGGNDFLASLSGIRAKERERRPRSRFGVNAEEQNEPNISWVEDVVFD